MAVFGYSFWLVVLATLSFVLNIVIIALTTSQPKSRKKVTFLLLVNISAPGFFFLTDGLTDKNKYVEVALRLGIYLHVLCSDYHEG